MNFLAHRNAQHTTPQPKGQRIIPARAGFTGPRSSRPAGTQDHPRSRGVYWNSVTCIIERMGSSPLARGLPRAHALLSGGPRIIPARAGFTHGGANEVAVLGDHPRSRGVYISVCRLVTVETGSSPLARGLPFRLRGGGRSRRIIPARAGFTRQRHRQHPYRRDHPRSRGVYWNSVTCIIERMGSSPLARGLLEGRIRSR